MTPEESKKQTQKNKKSDKQTKGETKNKLSPTIYANLLSGVAIILVFIAIIAGGFLWYHMSNRFYENKVLIAQIKKDNDIYQSQLLDIKAQLLQTQNELQQQKLILSENQGSIKKLVRLYAAKQDKFIYSQVLSMLQLADLNLRFTHDVHNSKVLLNLADQSLSQVVDPNVITLRQQIADNLVSLNALPKIDVAGLLTQLTAISSQIKNLPLIDVIQKETNKQAEQINSEQRLSTTWKEKWEDAWRRTLNAIEKIIVVRYHSEPLRPMISPKDQGYLIKNIQMLLQQASWALIHRNNTVYHFSLAQAQKLIEQNYATDAEQTKSVLMTIKKLKIINLEPKLPDLTKTITLANQLLTDTKATKQEIQMPKQKQKKVKDIRA